MEISQGRNEESIVTQWKFLGTHVEGIAATLKLRIL